MSNKEVSLEKAKSITESMANVKNPEYWEGVFDTLHLIHSYFDHFEDHPDSMNPKEYVKAAKRAVRRKCKSCLTDLLDIPFEKME